MKKLVDNAIKFWTQVGNENGWVLGKRGVTVWVDENGDHVDSCYNPKNEENKSYIVNYDTEEIIHTINK